MNEWSRNRDLTTNDTVACVRIAAAVDGDADVWDVVFGGFVHLFVYDLDKINLLGSWLSSWYFVTLDRLKCFPKA